jgi:hypothetical protein
VYSWQRVRVIATQTSTREFAKHRWDKAAGRIFIYMGGFEVMCYVSRGVACRLEATANNG